MYVPEAIYHFSNNDVNFHTENDNKESCTHTYTYINSYTNR